MASSEVSCTAHATFTEGDSTDTVTFTTRGKTTYPDALADLRAEAVAGFKACHREIRDVHVTDPEPTVISFQEPDA